MELIAVAIAAAFFAGERVEQERLNLYFMDMKYVRDLHNADDRVQSVSPQIRKSRRPFVGVVVVCGEHK